MQKKIVIERGLSLIADFASKQLVVTDEAPIIAYRKDYTVDFKDLVDARFRYGKQFWLLNIIVALITEWGFGPVTKPPRLEITTRADKKVFKPDFVNDEVFKSVNNLLKEVMEQSNPEPNRH